MDYRSDDEFKLKLDFFTEDESSKIEVRIFKDELIKCFLKQDLVEAVKCRIEVNSKEIAHLYVKFPETVKLESGKDIELILKSESAIKTYPKLKLVISGAPQKGSKTIPGYGN
jgi:hypothetical protein